MRINKFTINNFKAFEKEVTVPIKPITLVFGPNSAGKSSIIQALLLLKQSLETKKKTGYLPGYNYDNAYLKSGEFLSFGNMSELRFYNNKKENLLKKYYDLNKEKKAFFSIDKSDWSEAKVLKESSKFDGVEGVLQQNETISFSFTIPATDLTLDKYIKQFYGEPDIRNWEINSTVEKMINLAVDKANELKLPYSQIPTKTFYFSDAYSSGYKKRVSLLIDENLLVSTQYDWNDAEIHDYHFLDKYRLCFDDNPTDLHRKAIEIIAEELMIEDINDSEEMEECYEQWPFLS